MATNKIDSCRYASYKDASLGVRYVETFTKSARTISAAEDIDYPEVPTGYYGIFAGFQTSGAYVILNSFNPNASGAETVVSNRNTNTTTYTNYNCVLHFSYIRSDIIDDQRST